jgi:hypothetical protein
MTYELAKELKDAGFPQEGEFWYSFNEHGNGTEWEVYHYLQNLDTEEWFSLDKTKNILSPTLSELIEACGEMFGNLSYAPGLVQKDHAWCCNEELGKTPEEAVANLYLALNKTVDNR